MTVQKQSALALAAVAVAAAVTGCGGAGETPKTAVVSIDTFAFSPAALRVPVGTTLTWTNHDDILHTVTSGTRSYDPTNSGSVTETRKDGRFDAPLDGKSSTAAHVFTERGTYHYFCDRHPGMEADVEVV